MLQYSIKANFKHFKYLNNFKKTMLTNNIKSKNIMWKKLVWYFKTACVFLQVFVIVQVTPKT